MQLGDLTTRRRSRRARGGVALLEAIVALTILATAGASAAVLATEVVRVVDRSRSLDRDVARASELLDAVALWTREDLDRHLGDRPQGPWRMRVAHADPVLYDIVIADSTNGVTLVRTTLYRESDAAR
jgi:type II secretory pathway pseudopilin PulG